MTGRPALALATTSARVFWLATRSGISASERFGAVSSNTNAAVRSRYSYMVALNSCLHSNRAHPAFRGSNAIDPMAKHEELYAPGNRCQAGGATPEGNPRAVGPVDLLPIGLKRNMARDRACIDITSVSATVMCGRSLEFLVRNCLFKAPDKRAHVPARPCSRSWAQSRLRVRAMLPGLMEMVSLARLVAIDPEVGLCSFDLTFFLPQCGKTFTTVNFPYIKLSSGYPACHSSNGSLFV